MHDSFSIFKVIYPLYRPLILALYSTRHSYTKEMPQYCYNNETLIHAKKIFYCGDSYERLKNSFLHLIHFCVVARMYIEIYKSLKNKPENHPQQYILL